MASSGTSSTRKRFTGAEFIVHFLEQQGIKIVTGIPGGSILPVYDALSQSTQIRHILARHEQGAGFIAQGMARTDGKPAVCMACSGPGATNLVTAIADARLDSIPLICITGQVPASMIGTDAFQEVDTYGISIPITKHNYLVRHIEELPQVMSDAFRIAQSGRPGPVWIDIPKDVQTAVFEIEAQPAVAEKAAAPAFSEESIRDAATMINAAKRPVLYLGGGVINAPARVRELAEKAQLPTTMTLMALGMLPKAHPLSLGMLGMHGVRSTNYILQEADLLIVLGARFDDRAIGKTEQFCPNAKIIHVDIDRAELGKIKQPHVAIQADVDDVLAQLIPLVEAQPRAEWHQLVADLQREFPCPIPKACDPLSHYGLINAVAGQTISVVSPVCGTTTDTVEKAMELLPIGAVVLIDTPGLDDTGTLGELRVQQARRAFSHTNLAVLVIDASTGMTEADHTILQQLEQQQIPVLQVWNKCDIADSVPETGIAVSARTGQGIQMLKEQLGKLYQQHAEKQPPSSLFGSLLRPEDVVLLVTPIDESAPKGRMILPQVQAIREILDRTAVCLVTQPEQLAHTLSLLKQPPRLVVTDSQAFGQVKSLVPENILVTSFSILFARYKGVLAPAMQAAQTLETLPENSRILISEGCTHHRQCNDIGTVKLPRWITAHTGKQFSFSFSSGNSFPEDLTPYRLVVHCGGCMLNQREMETRAAKAAAQGIPYTNYGVLIAYLNGILERSLTFLKALENTE